MARFLHFIENIHSQSLALKLPILSIFPACIWWHTYDISWFAEHHCIQQFIHILYYRKSDFCLVLHWSREAGGLVIGMCCFRGFPQVTAACHHSSAAIRTLILYAQIFCHQEGVNSYQRAFAMVMPRLVGSCRNSHIVNHFQLLLIFRSHTCILGK